MSLYLSLLIVPQLIYRRREPGEQSSGMALGDVYLFNLKNLIFFSKK